MSEVLEFIAHFHKVKNPEVIDNLFTNGCCYWFSLLLHSRFKGSIIMYDPIENHFVTKIEDRLYDVTGDVTGKYNVIDWETYDDDIHKKRIISQCIDFTYKE